MGMLAVNTNGVYFIRPLMARKNSEKLWGDNSLKFEYSCTVVCWKYAYCIRCKKQRIFILCNV